MFGVEMIWRPTDDVLVVRRPIWLRLLGAILAALASSMIVMMGVMVPGFPTKTLLLLGGPALVGLHIALSHASVAFRGHSHVCMVRWSVFGVLLWKRDLEFSEARIRRQFDWNRLGWLYRINLMPEGPYIERPVRLGHMTNRTRCEALAQTIAQFTDSFALDHKGRMLPQYQSMPDQIQGTS